MADSGHPPAELHERLLICRTIKLNAGAHGGHRRCCHAQMQKNAQNKPQIARLILCVHTTLQVYCNLFLTFCLLLLMVKFQRFFVVILFLTFFGTEFLLTVCRPVGTATHSTDTLTIIMISFFCFSVGFLLVLPCLIATIL